MKRMRLENDVVGIDTITLKEAKRNAKKKKYQLIYQSKVPEDAVGILKSFEMKEKSGLCFIPLFVKGEVVVSEKRHNVTNWFIDYNQ